MADLDVVRKKKSSFPWILLGLLLIALIAFLVWNNSRDGDVAPTPVTTDTVNQVDTAGAAVR